MNFSTFLTIVVKRILSIKNTSNTKKISISNCVRSHLQNFVSTFHLSLYILQRTRSNDESKIALPIFIHNFYLRNNENEISKFRKGLIKQLLKDILCITCIFFLFKQTVLLMILGSFYVSHGEHRDHCGVFEGMSQKQLLSYFYA